EPLPQEKDTAGAGGGAERYGPPGRSSLALCRKSCGRVWPRGPPYGPDVLTRARNLGPAEIARGRERCNRPARTRRNKRMSIQPPPTRGAAANATTADEVLEFAAEHGAQLVDLKFTDLPGMWQHM